MFTYFYAITPYVLTKVNKSYKFIISFGILRTQIDNKSVEKPIIRWEAANVSGALDCEIFQATALFFAVEKQIEKLAGVETQKNFHSKR